MCAAARWPHCTDLRPGTPTRSAIDRERCPPSLPYINSPSAVARAPATRRDAATLLSVHRKPFLALQESTKNACQTQARVRTSLSSDRADEKKQNARFSHSSDGRHRFHRRRRYRFRRLPLPLLLPHPLPPLTPAQSFRARGHGNRKERGLVPRLLHGPHQAHGGGRLVDRGRNDARRGQRDGRRRGVDPAR